MGLDEIANEVLTKHFYAFSKKENGVSACR
jgi:hypothetical protein